MFSVLGNHDYGDYSKWETLKKKKENFEAIKQFYEHTGFKLLLNESVIVSKNSERIAIIGVENWGKPPFKKYGNLQKAIVHIKDIPFKILFGEGSLI